MKNIDQLMLDTKYANLVGLRLSRFRVKQSHPYLATFRCPYCGDSQKSKYKTRGFFLEKDYRITFKCHNCDESRSFKKFLAENDSQFYNDYLFECFKAKKNPIQKIEESKPKEKKQRALIGLKKISELPDNHPARKLISKRQLPADSYERLYYAPKFAKFVNNLIPNKLKENNEEPRLIIPFFDRNGNCFGFQGRAFNPESMRYITIMLDPEATKIFGYERINFNKRIYVLEGALDSLFIHNSVAVSHADLSSVDHLLKSPDVVYVPDKDRRNPQIIRLIKKLASKGKSVCLLPDNLPGKDINEFVLNGIDPSKLKDIIDEHTYKGVRLKLELAKWNKT